MHLSCEKKKSQCRLCRALCTYWHSSQYSETMLGSHLDSHLSTKSLTPESTSALEFFFLPQTIGLYSHFEQTPRSQKAQDKLSTLSKEYFNWAFWNLFARIQEKLIKESLPENKTVLREEKIKAAWRESTSFWANSRPSHYLLKAQITANSEGVLFKHTTSSRRHWRRVFYPVSGRFQPVINVTSTKAPPDLNWLIPCKKPLRWNQVLLFSNIAYKNFSLHFKNTGEVREVSIREVYTVSLQYKVGNYSRWHPLTLKFSALKEKHLTSSFTASHHLKKSALSSKILETSRILSAFFLWSDQTETCLTLPVWLKPPCSSTDFLEPQLSKISAYIRTMFLSTKAKLPVSSIGKPTSIIQHYPERSKPTNK